MCVMNFRPFNSFFIKNFINKKQMNGLIYSLDEYSNARGRIQKIENYLKKLKKTYRKESAKSQESFSVFNKNQFWIKYF